MKKAKGRKAKVSKVVMDDWIDDVEIYGLSTEDIQKINTVLDYYAWEVSTFLPKEKLVKELDSIRRLKSIFTEQWYLNPCQN